ncbi:MAG: hypothetical protein NVS9B10_03560 [Nevskia sp.]
MEQDARRRPLAKSLEVLAELGELPDELRPSEIMHLWHRHWGAKASPQAQADWVRLCRAIRDKKIVAEIIAGKKSTKIVRGPAYSVTHWDDCKAPTFRSVTMKNPSVSWIARDAMRTWLESVECFPPQGPVCLLQKWWPEIAQHAADVATIPPPKMTGKKALKRFDELVSAGYGKRAAMKQASTETGVSVSAIRSANYPHKDKTATPAKAVVKSRKRTLERTH